MLDTPSFTPAQMRRLRRAFHAMNGIMLLLWKLGLGRFLNSWPGVGGRIMVIRHRGRRSGRFYLTPVNYAVMDGDIYCTAGFGPRTDWYRNILAEAHVMLWLPRGWRSARAEDASSFPRRLLLMRQVIIASGIAGRLLGVDQRKYSDDQLEAVTKDYRLLHFTLEENNGLSRR